MAIDFTLAEDKTMEPTVPQTQPSKIRKIFNPVTIVGLYVFGTGLATAGALLFT